MAEVVEIRCIEDLAQIATTWRALWLQTPRRNFFQAFEWLQIYWRHFGHEQQLRVLVTRAGGETLGILPLVLRREKTRGGTFRVLTYPLDDWGSFYGPIGPDVRTTLSHCLAYLRHRPRDWDLLDLRWVPRTDGDDRVTPDSMVAAGFPCAEYVWKQTALLDFRGTWADYFATRCGKFRSNLRRAEQAAQAAEVTFHRYRPEPAEKGRPEPRWDYFQDCVGLAARSWQGSSPTGTTLSHPHVQGYFRDLFGAAAQAGALDINMLRQQGRLIAFSYNLVCDGRLDGLRIGFDRTVSHLSPGRLLLARSIADSFQRGDTWLDMGGETMAFKQAWLTRTASSMHYIHYPRVSPRSQLLRMKHYFSRQASQSQTSNSC